MLYKITHAHILSLSIYIYILTFFFKMDDIILKLKSSFPFLLHNALRKVYQARCEKLRMLMNKGILVDVCWIIEAKIRLVGESPNSFISHMPGMEKSSYAKKRRAKRLKICHKCARWTCNQKYCFLGMVYKNREDKENFIKGGLCKESLDNILLTLEMHPSGDVHGQILCL